MYIGIIIIRYDIMDKEERFVSVQIKIPESVYFEMLRVKGTRTSWFKFFEQMVIACYSEDIKNYQCDMKKRVEEMEGEINAE